MKKVALLFTGLLLISIISLNAQINILGGVQGGTYDKMINEMTQAMGKVEREGRTLSMDNVSIAESKGSFYNYINLKSQRKD